MFQQNLNSLDSYNYMFEYLICQCLGNLEDEEKVLTWLDHQVKSDEIEDITDEMLDMLIDKMPHVAVLFCKLHLTLIIMCIKILVDKY